MCCVKKHLRHPSHVTFLLQNTRYSKLQELSMWSMLMPCCVSLWFFIAGIAFSITSLSPPSDGEVILKNMGKRIKWNQKESMTQACHNKFHKTYTHILFCILYFSWRQTLATNTEIQDKSKYITKIEFPDISNGNFCLAAQFLYLSKWLWGNVLLALYAFEEICHQVPVPNILMAECKKDITPVC